MVSVEDVYDRRFFGSLGVVVALTAAFAAWVGTGFGGETTALYVDDVATVLAALAATALCVRAARRHTATLRVFWWLLGVGSGAWALGEGIWLLYDLASPGNVPVPSWADAAYLAALPPIAAALLVHPAVRGRAVSMTRSVVDGLVVASALFLLEWTLVFEPVERTTDLSSLGGLVTFAYPLSDIVIIFLIVLVVRGTTRGDRLDLWCLLAGLLAITLSDTIYTYLTDVKNYSSGNAIDVGWFAGYLGIALGALHARPETTSREPSGARPVLTPAALVTPFLPMLAALTLIAVRLELGQHLDRVTFALAFLLVGLVLVRQVLLLIDLLAPEREPEGGLADKLVAALGGATTNHHPEPATTPQGRQ